MIELVKIDPRLYCYFCKMVLISDDDELYSRTYVCQYCKFSFDKQVYSKYEVDVQDTDITLIIIRLPTSHIFLTIDYQANETSVYNDKKSMNMLDTNEIIRLPYILDFLSVNPHKLAKKLQTLITFS